MAYHFEAADADEKALVYLLRAGDQARIAYAHEEAADYYQRALAILENRGEIERAARILMKLGLTYHTAFDFQRSRQAFEESFALSQPLGEIESTSSPPPAPHELRVTFTQPLALDQGSVFAE